MTKGNVWKRDFISTYGSRVLVAGEAEHGGRTRKLAENTFLLHKKAKQKKAGTGTMLQILKALPLSDALPLANLYLIQLPWPPRQSHQLGSKCQNT